MKQWTIAALSLALSLGFAGAARAQTGTKVAVVNVGEVFMKYEKAASYKAELEKIVGPRKAEADKLKNEIKAWQDAMKHPKFDPKDKERYEQAIVANIRKLEDMQRQVQAEIGKKQETQIITLYKDLNTAIDAFAKANSYQLVLGYGDITGDLFTVENIDRKMKGMDLGSTTPLFMGAGVNVTEPIIQTLNNMYRTSAGAGAPTGVTPVSGTRP
ncbi:MAG: OmpH family outer membrane protein [Gemmataceae bacterium]